MGVSKVWIALIVLSLAFVGAWADAAPKLDGNELKSKISKLESSLSEQLHKLKNKDERLKVLEKVVEDKSATISVMQSEIDALKKEDAADSKELLAKANAEAAELEKQVEKLMNKVELESRKKDALEFRAHEAEMKIEELNLKIEDLQKTNDEQKREMEKLEHNLQVAEEELMKAQLEATAKLKELREVAGAWLPPWLATHCSQCQELMAIYWKKHGEPALAIFLQKVSEKSAEAQKLVEPHLKKAKAEWLPAIRERWFIIVTNAEPVVKTMHAKTVDLYDLLKNNVEPHIVKVQELADPYYQEAKKLSKPYIDQMASVTKPHVERLHVVLKPYKSRVIHVYGKFLESATTYHQRVQVGIQEQLKKYELTESLATKELVWFMASAFLALPIFLVYRLMSDIFFDNARKKATSDSPMNHAHRRNKRRHADK